MTFLYIFNDLKTRYCSFFKINISVCVIHFSFLIKTCQRLNFVLNCIFYSFFMLNFISQSWFGFSSSASSQFVAILIPFRCELNCQCPRQTVWALGSVLFQIPLHKLQIHMFGMRVRVFVLRCAEDYGRGEGELWGNA